MEVDLGPKITKPRLCKRQVMMMTLDLNNLCKFLITQHYN